MTRSSSRPLNGSDILVSLVVPVYNGNRSLLVRCIDSILLQSHDLVEILVVDDGSADELAAWMDATYRENSRVSVIHQPNRGVSAARNSGIRLARGAYVGFVDCDDYVRQDFVRDALNVAISTTADIVFGGIKIRRLAGSSSWRSGDFSAARPEVLGWPELSPVRAGILSDSPSLTSDSSIFSVTNVVSALYRTDLIRQLSFAEGVSHAEDRLYNVSALGLAKRVAFCSDIWYVYDQTSPDGVTRSISASTGMALKQTILAFAATCGSAMSDQSGGVPPDAAFERSASDGVLNYFKLMTWILAESASRSQAVSSLEEVLTDDQVNTALSSVRPTGLTDRLFVWCARRQRARTLVALGIVREVLARRRS